MLLAQVEMGLSWLAPWMNAGATAIMASVFVWQIGRQPAVERERHEREMERDRNQDAREEKRWNWHKDEIKSVTDSVDNLRVGVEKLADKISELPCRGHLVNLALPAGSLRPPAVSPPSSASSGLT